MCNRTNADAASKSLGDLMKLLTEEIRAQLPGLKATENQHDPIAFVRLEARWLGWAWYVMEFDGDDVCYGYACMPDGRLAHFDLAEIRSLRGPFWQSVKRDRRFRPTPLSVVRARLK